MVLMTVIFPAAAAIVVRVFVGMFTAAAVVVRVFMGMFTAAAVAMRVFVGMPAAAMCCMFMLMFLIHVIPPQTNI